MFSSWSQNYSLHVGSRRWTSGREIIRMGGKLWIQIRHMQCIKRTFRQVVQCSWQTVLRANGTHTSCPYFPAWYNFECFRKDFGVFTELCSEFQTAFPRTLDPNKIHHTTWKSNRLPSYGSPNLLSFTPNMGCVANMLRQRTRWRYHDKYVQCVRLTAPTPPVTRGRSISNPLLLFCETEWNCFVAWQ
jgi:hypothetical protein